MSWQSELERARKRWLEAKAKGDSVMMSLWERYGRFVKGELEKSLRRNDLYEQAKAIFSEPASSQDTAEASR